jgi:hypothetical protein
VEDGLDQELRVPVVQSADGAAKIDGDAVGEAGREQADPLLASFSKLEMNRLAHCAKSFRISL